MDTRDHRWKPENSGVRGQQREQPRQMDAVINGDEES